jgi:RimJ/RimL family protein N-acetyltransferase
MIEMVPLEKQHYAGLYEIALRTEPFAADFMPTVFHFNSLMKEGEGWALKDGENLIGAITLSGLIPLLDVFIHVFVEKQYHGKWMSRKIGKIVGRHVFNNLSLPRMSSFAVKDVTPEAEIFLVELGFRLEGIKEKAAKMPDGYHDLILYGVLKERWRWQ